MKKLLLLSTVVLLLFAGTAPVSAAHGPPTDGFRMNGANAAYVDFYSDDDCSVFVGHVWAKRVKNFATGEVVRPHSDLQVKLNGTCAGPGGTEIEATVGTVGDDRAEIVKLRWADVDSIDLPLADGRTVTVDLRWDAYGDVFRERFHEPGMRAWHRTTLAEVTGKVTVTAGAGHDAFDTTGFSVDPLARITRYHEVQGSHIP